VSESPHASAVRRFYETFNQEDLDGLVALLHPLVELQTARGVREGREEAREWADRNPGGGLEQRLVLEEVREDEHGVHAVALIRKQWWWIETRQVAHDEPEAALFTFRGGLIARWQPFEDREAALGAAGIDS
jgi:ketosteroid isomerase-like protein